MNARQELIEQNRMRQRMELRFEKRLLREFERIGKQASEVYESEAQLRILLDSIEPTLSPIFQAHYRTVLEEFSRRQAQVLNLPKEETRFDRMFRTFMEEVGAENVQQVSETTIKRIRAAILEAFALELATDDIAKMIRESVGGSIGRYRSRLIARTETHTAASYANHKIALEADIPEMRKRWVSANDARTRPHHVEMNGIEVGLEEDFEVPYDGITYRMKYTGDPRGGPGNVCNCRCVTSYVVPEDFDQPAPVEQRWGDASKDEVLFHENNWSANKSIRDAIATTPAVPEVEYGVDRAFCSSQKIAMQTKKSATIGEDDKTVWRHEYGHWMDQKNELKDQQLWQTWASSTAAAQLVADSKKIIRNEKGAKKKRDEVYNGLGEQYEYTPQQMERDLRKEFVTAEDLRRLFDKDQLGLTGEEFVAYRKYLVSAIKTRFVGDSSIDGRYGLARLFTSGAFKSGEGICFSDFIGAVTNEEAGFGHGKPYYAKFPRADLAITEITQGNTTEAFANFVALTGGDNGDIWRKILTKFAPKTVAKFDQILEEMGSKGAKHDAGNGHLRKQENGRGANPIRGALQKTGRPRNLWSRYRQRNCFDF